MRCESDVEEELEAFCSVSPERSRCEGEGGVPTGSVEELQRI